MLKQTIKNGEIPLEEWEKLIVAMRGSDRGVVAPIGGGRTPGIDRNKLVAAEIGENDYLEFLTSQHHHVVNVQPEEMFTQRKLPPGLQPSVVNLVDGEWWMKRKDGWGHVLRPRASLESFTPRFRKARLVSIGDGKPFIGRLPVSAEEVSWKDRGSKIFKRHYGLRTEVTVHLDGEVYMTSKGPQIEIGVPEDVVDSEQQTECIAPDVILNVTRVDGGDGGGTGLHDAYVDGKGFIVAREFEEEERNIQGQSNTFRVRADFSYTTVDWESVSNYLNSQS